MELAFEAYRSLDRCAAVVPSHCGDDLASFGVNRLILLNVFTCALPDRHTPRRLRPSLCGKLAVHEILGRGELFEEGPAVHWSPGTSRDMIRRDPQLFVADIPKISNSAGADYWSSFLSPIHSHCDAEQSTQVHTIAPTEEAARQSASSVGQLRRPCARRHTTRHRSPPSHTPRSLSFGAAAALSFPA